MMIYSDCLKPDFKKALEKANDVLVSSIVIETFPFSIKKVIKEKTNIACRSYLKAGMYGIDIKTFGSQDAIYQNLEEKGIIFYNEEISSKERQRFSLNHEFGHIQLNHDLDNKNMYGIYEVETNFFAAQMLMPEQIINELINRGKQITVENLMSWFKVSKTAARKRLDTLRKIDFSHRSYDERVIDESIVLKYQTFIDSIAPKRVDYYDPYMEEELQHERDSWY
ncbi:ImmA/IrrE family metallo-endopeptidase [Massilicoli timonensis]|nr:ImmA/IrrE family metallo-endopeptidase [Massilicoli timonensis]